MECADLKNGTGTLVPRCFVARDFFSRFLGLMGRRDIAPDEAVLFPRCNSIHTFFMRFPIDVVLVDAGGVVVEVAEAVKPWRLLLPRRGVRHVIEMRAGRARELGIGEGVQLNYPGVW